MKKKVLLFVATTIIVYLLQVTFFKTISINSITPDFILVFLVFISFFRGSIYGSLYGFFLGFLLDLFFGASIGFNIAAYTIIGSLIGKTSNDYSKANTLIPLSSLLLSSFFLGILRYFIGFLFRGRMELLSYLFFIVLPELIYTMLIGISLYRVFDIIDDKILGLTIEEEIE